MRTKIILLTVLFLTGCFSYAAPVLTAKANGNWNSAATWSLDRVPANGDSIVIPAAFAVTISANEDYSGGAAMQINIFGVLAFDNGRKVKLSCGSEIFIQEGGRITVNGGGSSNNIDICGTIVWSSDQGDATGPMYLSQYSAMPIELKAFYILPEGNKVRLHWETATETNNKEFTIEKSRDGMKFEAIKVISSKAPGGNSLKSISYEFIDKKPLGGVSYYRFKQTDYNGRFEYFQVLSVDMEESKHITFTVYPNPNQGQFTVDFTGVENNHEIEVTMYDQQGKLAYQKSIMSESLATNTFSIIPDDKIASGVYMVNFVVEGVKYPVKVIVQ